MNPKARLIAFLAFFSNLKMRPVVTTRIRRVGLGTLAAGAVGSAVAGVPVSIMYEVGADHAPRLWSQGIYRISNLISKVRPDLVILYSCDWATAGNIVTLYNQENAGDTTKRVDAGMQVTSVSFEGKIHEIPAEVGAIAIQAKYGMMFFSRSGFYTYISEQKKVENHQSEDFAIGLIGENGAAEVVDLRVKAFQVERTANRMSDYGNQSSGPNQTVQGRDAYQTSLSSGAMVFGWTKNDILKGSSAGDAVFGWEGNDTIFGLDGDDLIMGEQGNNEIYGGKGADIFDFHSGKANNQTVFDTIHDFSLLEGDILSFSSVISNDEFVRIVAVENDFRAAAKFFKFAIEDGYLDILINSDGKGDDFFRVVRLMNNPGFDANEANLIEYLKKGIIVPG